MLGSTFLLAARGLLRSKTRSLLTALGVIIGVAAVIATVAMGEGARARVEEAFTSLGTNLLVILPGSNRTGGVQGGFGSASTVTWDDLKAIQQEVPSVRYAAPLLRGSGQVVSEEQNWSTQIYGTTADYFGIRRWAVASGVLIGGAGAEGAAKVAVVGQTVADHLFSPGIDPVGKVVRLKGVPFQIIGVLERKGQSPQGQDYDDAVYVPVKSYQANIQGGLASFITGTIFVSTSSPEA